MTNTAAISKTFHLKEFRNPKLKLFGKFASLYCTRKAAGVIAAHPELVMYHILRDPTRQAARVRNILCDEAGRELVFDSMRKDHSFVFSLRDEKLKDVDIGSSRRIEVPAYSNVVGALKIVEDNNLVESRIYNDVRLRKRLEKDENCVVDVRGPFTILFYETGTAYQSSILFDVYEFFWNFSRAHPELVGKPIVDLGSGLGHASFMISLFFDRVFGIELSKFLSDQSVLSAERLAGYIGRKTTIIHGDYNRYDLSRFELAYIWRDAPINQLVKTFLKFGRGSQIFMYGHCEDKVFLEKVGGLELVISHRRQHFGSWPMHTYVRF